MGTTPIYALRYPEPTDPANVPTDMHELATDVETQLQALSGAGAQLAYQEFIAPVTSAATTVAGAVQVVGLPATTYQAVPIFLEFYCPRLTPGVAQGFLVLRDGSTVLGTFMSVPGSGTLAGVFARRRHTPTAGSHTFNVAHWNASTASTTYQAGTGGTAGDVTTYLPGYLRAVRA